LKKTGVVYVNQNYCSGCGICIEFCPQDVLAKSNDQNHKGIQIVFAAKPEACTACMLCELYCPDFAIGIEEAVAP
jgi:2-oxoglutarate ferredoxin oxidoreductase subunit delta